MMIIFSSIICRRNLLVAANSYNKFHLQNSLSPTIFTLFSTKYSGLISPRSADDRSSFDRKGERAQAVLTLLRNHGFTEIQISKLVKVFPKVLSADPKNTLSTKIEFLSSIGISTTDLHAIILRSPSLLLSSLEKKLVPAYNFLKTILLSDKLVAKSIRNGSRIVFRIVGGPVALNLDVLRGAGVPQSRISFLLLRYPNVVCLNHDKFKRHVEDIIKMRFDPLKVIFIHAVQVKSQLSKPTWDRKVEVYKRCGLYDEEILLAFKKHPYFMMLSDEKVMKTMDFFVDKMSWKPAIIVRYPPVIFFNLEKRIIPRCLVIKALMSKGLIKKTLAPSSILLPTEKNFLDKFVRKYQDDLPGLIKLYRGKSVLLES